MSKFSKGAHITDDVLDYIHSDCWGPSRVEGIGGFCYFVLLVDDKSRYTWLRLLKSKNEIFKTFKQWKALVEKRKDRKIKKLRTDNGLEFCKEKLNQFCADKGIGRHHTVRRTPQQNVLRSGLIRHCLREFDACSLTQHLGESIGVKL